MTTADKAEPAEIVVFDFDGTITTDDTFRLFLRYYAGTAKWVVNILLLLPIFIGYGLKIVDRNQAKIHVTRRFFKNAPTAKLNARATDFAKEIIPGLIRPQAQACLDSKKQKVSHYIYAALQSPHIYGRGASRKTFTISLLQSWKQTEIAIQAR